MEDDSLYRIRPMNISEKKGKSAFLSYLVIIGVIVVVYLPTFTGEFILDDRPLIKNNPYIREAHSLISYLSQEDGLPEGGGGSHTGYYRPLINLSYWMDYKLWGMDARGFRTTNLILHVFTALLFFRLIVLLGGDEKTALFVTLLFAIHPSNTESVSWVASRNNILVTLFGIASIQLFARGKEKPSRIAMVLSLAAFSLALLSKEFGVLLLFVFFLYQRLIAGEKKGFFHEAMDYAPFIMVLVCYFVLRGGVTGAFLSPSMTGDMWVRVCFAPYLILVNTAMIFLPVGLHSLILGYPDSLLGWEVFAGLGSLALLGWMIWKKRESRVVSFGLLSFLIALFPVLNILQTSAASLVSMRWLYFPMPFLLLALSRFLQRMIRSKGPPAIIVSAVVLLYCGIYTHILNRGLWHDEKAFFRQEVLIHENDFYAAGLAEILLEEKHYQEAERYFRIAMKEGRATAKEYINYGALLIDTGRLGDALRALDQAKRHRLSFKEMGELHNNMGMVHFNLNRHDDGLRSFRKAVLYSPGEALFWSNLGGAYGSRGDFPKALAAFQEGLNFAPDSIPLRENLARTYLRMGDCEKAEAVLEKIPIQEMRRNSHVMQLMREARDKFSSERMDRPLPHF